MMGDVTQVQSDEQRHLARDLSLQRQQPPTQVPGYEPERFLGAGAYGEVWVATDRNTGRRVAIKFYAHRGGLDWSLLSREVDKLVLLFSDRYVVQLIEVGWNADPPYYVMEFLDRGSLDDRLRQGPMPVGEAVALFREVAVALVHAHGKGILHCDLKPANVLLDQDWKPRLADFGQSRLSHEQTPALGTMFYMAPEQADLNAAPDARWDVYALGALLYCMLTGQPPFRDAQLAEQVNQPGTLEHRLARYRAAITSLPRPSQHRKVPGMDRALVEIIDRCLAINPSHRFPNAQAVLDALDAREVRRARRPLLVLGAVGPALILAIISLLAWNGFHLAVAESTDSLTRSARVGNEFAAQVYADHIAIRIDRRWRIMENVADDAEFQQMVMAAAGKTRGSSERNALQSRIDALRTEHAEIPSFAWSVLDQTGKMLGRSPHDDLLVDRSFADRDFFHGHGHTHPSGGPPTPVTEVHRSIIYKSLSEGQPRLVAFSVPVWSGEPDQPGRQVVGVLVTTVEVGDFADFRTRDDASKDLVPVLIDTQPDDHGIRGAVLIHPHLSEIRSRDRSQPLPDCHIDPAQVKAWNTDYHDPVASFDPQYAGRWFAASEPVEVEGRGESTRKTGWVVIMQERYNAAIGPVLELKRKLVVRGAVTLVVIILMVTALWGFVIVILNGAGRPTLSALLRLRGGLGSEATTGTGLHTGPVAARPAHEALPTADRPTARMATEPPTQAATLPAAPPSEGEQPRG